jgi:hypothetical protein
MRIGFFIEQQNLLDFIIPDGRFSEVVIDLEDTKVFGLSRDDVPSFII